MKILAISGSLLAHSNNRALLTAAAGLTPRGVELVLFDGIGDLPHFRWEQVALRAGPLAALSLDAKNNQVVNVVARRHVVPSETYGVVI
jgi:hypothetical protein